MTHQYSKTRKAHKLWDYGRRFSPMCQTNFLTGKHNANTLNIFDACATTMTSQRPSIQSVATTATASP